MTSVNFWSAVVVATTMLSGPVMAREHHHLGARHSAQDSYASSVVPDTASADGRSCTRAPRAGAFATEPWTEPPCEPTTWY
jgi:hypothetical protein